jgi:hypothetical protein
VGGGDHPLIFFFLIKFILFPDSVRVMVWMNQFRLAQNNIIKLKKKSFKRNGLKNNNK